MSLSIGKLLLIVLILLLIFGAGRLPRVMGDIGKGIRSLRDGLKDDEPATSDTPVVQRRITDERPAEVTTPTKDSQPR